MMPVAAVEVSVLMPVYNNAPYLREAVESILNQSFGAFEFVIVDDGSSDGSSPILEEYAARDQRIRLFRNEENRGIVFTLNRGLAECRGEFIARMDSDDIALPERLAVQIARMRREPALAALGSSLSYIDAAGNELGVVRQSGQRDSLLMQNPLFHPTVVLRREVLSRHGLGYHEEYRYAEDYFLWLQLSRVGELGSVDDVLLLYRLTSGASRVRHLKKMIWATVRVKAAGVFALGIRPRVADVARFAADAALLLIPASLVFWIYKRITFGSSHGLLQ